MVILFFAAFFFNPYVVLVQLFFGKNRPDDPVR